MQGFSYVQICVAAASSKFCAAPAWFHSTPSYFDVILTAVAALRHYGGAVSAAVHRKALKQLQKKKIENNSYR